MIKQLFITAFITLSLTILLPSVAAADDYERRLITTNGHGEVKVKPDMATLHLNLTATRKEALAAKQEVDRRFNRFLAELKKLNIKQDDIVASTLQTSPQYQYSKIASKQEFTGYRASRSVQVTVRKLAQLTDIMDTALAAKIQNVSHIRYGSSEADKHRTEARQLAIAHSKQQATELAQAYRAELGSVVRINYRSSQPQVRGRAHAVQAEAFMAKASDSQGVYLPDELTFSDRIDVVFDLIIND